MSLEIFVSSLKYIDGANDFKIADGEIFCISAQAILIKQLKHLLSTKKIKNGKLNVRWVQVILLSKI